MPKVTTNSFKVSTAENLLQSIGGASAAYYITLGRPQGWSGGQPQTPNDSFTSTSFDVFDTMTLGKKVANTDLSMMVSRHDWTANTVYAMYDDKNSNLFNSAFYTHVTVGSAHYVFKCLDNNGGVPSTVQPDLGQTSASDDYYRTSDGYQWKYMFSISSPIWDKHATTFWHPVVEDAAVSSFAIPGSIDVVAVDNGGSRYNAYNSGTFSSFAADANGSLTICTISQTASANANFYTGCAIKVLSGIGAGQQRTITSYNTSTGNRVCTIDSAWNANSLPNSASTYEISPLVVITGDGTGAVARAVINATSNTISSVEITNRGSRYSFATALVSSNTGLTSNNTPITSNNAVLRPIISPKFGHGGDINEELGAIAVGIGISIAGTEGGTVSDSGSFAAACIVKDPKWTQVTLALTGLTGLFSNSEVVTVNGTTYSGNVISFNSGISQLVLSGVTGGFTSPAVIRGSTSNATATVTSSTIGGALKGFTTFDQRLRVAITYNGASQFASGDIVTQSISGASGTVQFANTSFVALTGLRGTFASGAAYQLSSNIATANVISLVLPDVDRNSGRALYVENVSPIARTSNSFKFVVGF